MGINVAQPIVFKHNGNDRMFLSASYGTGAAVFELTRNGERFQTKTIWENQRMKNKFTSSVLHNGFIYGLDESILACLDVNTGEQKWKGGRYGYGQIMLAGDHIIVLTEDGESCSLRATPERHEEIARFQAIEGKTLESSCDCGWPAVGPQHSGNGGVRYSWRPVAGSPEHLCSKVSCPLSLVLSWASMASAQLVAAKEGPVVYGHHHLNTTSVEAQKKFFVDTLGGTADQGGHQQHRDRPVPERVDLFQARQGSSGRDKGHNSESHWFLGAEPSRDGRQGQGQRLSDDHERRSDPGSQGDRRHRRSTTGRRLIDCICDGPG